MTSCQICRLAGVPTAHATFHHNVGMLFLRQTHTTSARMCGPCLRARFFHHLGRNLVLGWWGIISFFFTWYFLAHNVVAYGAARAELRRRAKLAQPEKPADGLAELERFEHTIRMRLRAGETPDDIAVDLAKICGLPWPHIAMHIEALGPDEPLDRAEDT